MMKTDNTIPAAPRAVLSNRVRVVNFSSPHPFLFEDGTELARCHPDRVSAFKMEVHEISILAGAGLWHDIYVRHLVTDVIITEMIRLHEDREIDIIIVPRVLLDAMKDWKRAIEEEMKGPLQGGGRVLWTDNKCRTIRQKERKDPPVNFIDKFCR